MPSAVNLVSEPVEAQPSKEPEAKKEGTLSGSVEAQPSQKSEAKKEGEETIEFVDLDTILDGVSDGMPPIEGELSVLYGTAAIEQIR